MANNDFIKNLAAAYEEFSKDNANGVYVLNQSQYAKFMAAAERLDRLVKEHGGKMLENELAPSDLHGCLQATVPVIDVYGDDGIENITKMLGNASVFGVSAKTNGELLIDITVPDVFKKIN